MAISLVRAPFGDKGGLVHNAASYADLDEVLAAIGVNPGVLSLPPGLTRTLTANTTIPANVTLRGDMGVLVVAAGVTLTIAGECPEVNWQMFDVSAAGAAVVGLRKANPLMFGGAAGGDIVAATNAAIAAVATSGGRVRVPRGTYSAGSTIVVSAGVTLDIEKSALIEATAATQIVRVMLGGRLAGDGMIDLSGYAATGIYFEGESGWNTAADTAPTNCNIRVFGDYTAGQKGVHLYASGATNKISFLHVRGVFVQRCYNGVVLEAESSSYINGNTLDISIAGCVYGWTLGSSSEAQTIEGNICRGQIQTTPQTERVLYCNALSNDIELLSWDWDTDRAGYPFAVELDVDSGLNRVRLNNLQPGYFRDVGGNNEIVTNHWLTIPIVRSIVPTGFFYSAFAGNQDDILLGATNRYTVTNSFSASAATMARLFSAEGDQNVGCSTCGTGTPQTVTVDFGTGLVLDAIGLFFGQSRYATKVKIEVDNTGAGNWLTIIDVQDNSAYLVRAHINHGGAGVSVGSVYKIRITIEGYASGQTEVFLNRLWAFSRYEPGSLLTVDDVTGSRANTDAALANLLAVLERKGIITDSTTA